VVSYNPWKFSSLAGDKNADLVCAAQARRPSSWFLDPLGIIVCENYIEAAESDIP